MTLEKAVYVGILCGALMMASGEGFATSPPAPKPFTAKQMIGMSDAAFHGKVISVHREPLKTIADPEGTKSGAGVLSLEVEILDLYLGDTRVIKRHVRYLVGRSSLTEREARAKYAGKKFVFLGNVERLSGIKGIEKIQVVFPPSGMDPLDVDRIPEIVAEIGKREGMAGPGKDQPGKK